MYDRKLKVIIAHIERFIDFQKGTNYINELLSLGTLVQMNGEYINGFFTKSKALSMIKDGKFIFWGLIVIILIKDVLT